MKYLTIALLAILSACGQRTVIDPVLAPYVSQFIQEGAARNVMVNTDNLVVEFSDDMDLNERGHCETVLKNKTVKILRSVWDGMAEGYRLQVVYHELGHCLLGRAHDNDTNSLGIANSIMNANLSSVEYWDRPLKEQQGLIDELFTDK